MADGVLASTQESWDFKDHVRGTIYGHCIGDALGLLTEFYNKEQARMAYSCYPHLEYEHKVDDHHRVRWQTGDWTDDSDQMILILDMLLANNGVVDPLDYSKRLMNWALEGFSELGDLGGMGIGHTTKLVLNHELYSTDPHAAAEDIWNRTGCFVAPNGAVMRTSVLGLHRYKSLSIVAENAKQIAKVTHADYRCIASCVAVVTAISFMLQRQPQHMKPDGDYDLDVLIRDVYKIAKTHLHGKRYKKHKKELKKHMYAETLSELQLDDKQAIGYTYKALGAGFWVLRQNDFRTAMEALVREGGDADSNGSVAGALLGCRVGAKKLPPSWRDKLLHKQWLDDKIDKFIALQKTYDEDRADVESEIVDEK